MWLSDVTKAKGSYEGLECILVCLLSFFLYFQLLQTLPDAMSKSLHSSQSISERRFAEKLTILTERGHGLLTRIYSIKKVRMRKGQVPAHEKHVHVL